MKDFLELYRYTFAYKWLAIKVIIYNLLFVVFNLLSLILFIPVLQLIFNSEKVHELLPKPEYLGGFISFFQYIVDLYNYEMAKMVHDDPKYALLFVCFTVFLAFFFKNLFRYGAVWHQSELRMSAVRDVRNNLFLKALQLPLSFYSNERKGDLIARMQSDVGEIEIAVVAVLEIIFRDPIAIVTYVATLIYFSPQLTLISFILLPISALVISRIGKSLKRTAKEGQEQMGHVFSTIDEGLSGIKIIKAFNAIGQVFENFKGINLKHQQLITKTFRKKDLSPILNETLGVAVMMCLVWFGGSIVLDQVTKSPLTGEKFMTFVVVFSQLLRPIQAISTNLTFINKAKVSLDRINAVLNEDEKIIEKVPAIPLPDFNEGIQFENVSFRYRDQYVLKNINLNIPKGKTVAIVGESGSGKSTLGDLIPRFYDPTEGRVLFDSKPITDCSITDLRRHIGIVSQESFLFNASIQENIAFGMPDASMEAIIEAAKIANAHGFIMDFTDGYHTNIGDRGNKLSGGQKQRISIARAVLKNPSVLILDEATSALDTESEKLVQDALDHLLKDRTSIMIAHRLSTIRKADQIIVLSKGEIIEQGTHEELLSRKGLYYNLCTLQGMTD